jgi:uncharacterized protein (TIGR02246 family)
MATGLTLRLSLRFALSGLVLGLTGATAATPDPELAAFKKEIRQLYDLKEHAWAAGDAETIVTKFYAPDAISIGEGDPGTLAGREQFRETYRKYVKDVTSVRIESVRTVVNGNAGWDWTNFYATVRPEKAGEYPPPLVRVLFLWSKEGGHWVCKGDVFVNGGFKGGTIGRTDEPGGAPQSDGERAQLAQKAPL